MYYYLFSLCICKQFHVWKLIWHKLNAILCVCYLHLFLKYMYVFLCYCFTDKQNSRVTHSENKSTHWQFNAIFKVQLCNLGQGQSMSKWTYQKNYALLWKKHIHVSPIVWYYVKFSGLIVLWPTDPKNNRDLDYLQKNYNNCPKTISYKRSQWLWHLTYWLKNKRAIDPRLLTWVQNDRVNTFCQDLFLKFSLL